MADSSYAPKLIAAIGYDEGILEDVLPRFDTISPQKIGFHRRENHRQFEDQYLHGQGPFLQRLRGYASERGAEVVDLGASDFGNSDRSYGSVPAHADLRLNGISDLIRHEAVDAEEFAHLSACVRQSAQDRYYQWHQEGSSRDPLMEALHVHKPELVIVSPRILGAVHYDFPKADILLMPGLCE